MKPNEARRRITVLEDQLDLLKDPESFYSSRYFRDAIDTGSAGLVRAATHGQYFERYDQLASRPTLLDEYAAQLGELPDSNGQRWFEPLSYTIGIICDDFLYASFEGSVGLIRITPENYQEAAERCDLLLVTTTWRGIDKEWLLLGSKGSYSWRRLNDLVIPEFRRHGKPVAYYSKEDPPNYTKFLHLARLCDFAFTSAAECVAKYERDCPNLASVSVLPFSVSAKHHNPVGSRVVRIPEVLFAGSWHNRKYSTRRTHGMRILMGVDDSVRDLCIVDRNSGERRLRYAFPEQFLRNINPAIAHDVLLRLQKATEISINLNSVPASDTMFANRAIEVQGMGGCLISSYNKGLNSLFPNVYMPDTRADTRDLIDTMTDDVLRTTQMQGIRNAYSGNTNFDRMAFLCATVGLTVAQRDVVIGAIGDPAVTAGFLDSQITTDPTIELRAFPDEAAAAAGGAVAITEPDPAWRYAPYFVQDLANAFKYVNADRISAPIDFAGPIANPVEHNFGPVEQAPAASLTWLAGGRTATGYTVQRGLVEQATPVRVSTGSAAARPLLSVVVPIYNNGRHLEYKCLASLRRSSIFDRMEVILVDDGSSDPQTVAVVDRLERELPNAVVHRNPVGGSGSASRPRNQGLELASAPYVTYLDPDNEAMNDAYARLVELVRENDTNFAIGNMLRFSTSRKIINNVVYLRQVLQRDENWPNVWHVPPGVLETLEFRPMSIQALVADTAWLKSLRLEQPVGGVGQDTYFFQQMIHYAQRISIFDDPVHVYFAGVANSTVNAIGAKFFRKYLPLEAARADWLVHNGLLDAYNDKRLEQFTRGWYLQKFNEVRDDERAEAFALLEQILAMYGKSSWNDPAIATRLDELRAELAEAPVTQTEGADLD
ncbi:glycosyltransferase involved in cell wall biosynthesis [Naumannella cuiyingiana]|uniref:Glycosyltransferase involved in cell wall biosynthesis n=1 Tax=Naumannella cuiyingiana TaxID=1347891 RepID=A0A7Z0ILE8_9ACTN|nr:glycosyltransferase [Naumannella cuiyingiana]NYI71452.1 glycosyltransferase involved in cell wall biosynthesis [Naumannella cuiyingiana]